MYHHEKAGEIANGFPRLYAAASLKPISTTDQNLTALSRFPRLYAAASLKRAVGQEVHRHEGVFRGFMPRPH